MTKDNNLLGKFELMGLPQGKKLENNFSTFSPLSKRKVFFLLKAPRGIPRVQVTFNVDANGILSVNAREESTGKSKNIKIKNEKGRLNKSEIDKMVSEAEKFKEDDEKCKQRVSSRNLLESYLFSVRAALKEYGSKLVEQEQTQLEKLINENIFWLENNRERDAALYEEKFKDLQRVIIPVMNKFHKKNEQDGPKIEEVN